MKQRMYDMFGNWKHAASTIQCSNILYKR